MLGTSHKLTQYDRKVLQDLDEILTPFETATQCIQGDKIVTSSMIVPCIRVLKASMAKLSNKFLTWLVSALKTSVDDRLSLYEEREAFLFASALDPRFKLKWCSSSDEYSSIKAKFVAKVKSANAEDVVVESSHDASQSTSSSVTGENHKKNKSLSFFDELIQDRVVSTTSYNEESMIDEYLSSLCLQQEEDLWLTGRIMKRSFHPLLKLSQNT